MDITRTRPRPDGQQSDGNRKSDVGKRDAGDLSPDNTNLQTRTATLQVHWSDNDALDQAESSVSEDSDITVDLTTTALSKATSSTARPSQARGALDGIAGLPNAALRSLSCELHYPDDPKVVRLITWLAERSFAFDDAFLTSVSEAGKLGHKDQCAVLAEHVEAHFTRNWESLTRPMLRDGRHTFHVDADRARVLDFIADCLVGAQGQSDLTVAPLLMKLLGRGESAHKVLSASQLRLVMGRLRMLMSGEQALARRLNALARTSPIHSHAARILHHSLHHSSKKDLKSKLTPREVHVAVLASLFHVIRQPAGIGSCITTSWSHRQHVNAPGAYLDEVASILQSGEVLTRSADGDSQSSPVCHRPNSNYLFKTNIHLKATTAESDASDARSLSLEVLSESVEIVDCLRYLNIPSSDHVRVLRSALDALALQPGKGPKSASEVANVNLGDLLRELAIIKHGLTPTAWQALCHFQERETEHQSTSTRRRQEGKPGGKDLDQLRGWLDKAEAKWAKTNGASWKKTLRTVEQDLEQLTTIAYAPRVSTLVNAWALSATAKENQFFLDATWQSIDSGLWSLMETKLLKTWNLVQTVRDLQLYPDILAAAKALYLKRASFSTQIYPDDEKTGSYRGKRLFISQPGLAGNEKKAVKTREEFAAFVSSLVESACGQLASGASKSRQAALKSAQAELVAFAHTKTFVDLARKTLPYGEPHGALPWAHGTTTGTEGFRQDLQTDDGVSSLMSQGATAQPAKAIREEKFSEWEIRSFPDAKSLLQGFVDFARQARRQGLAGADPEARLPAVTGGHAFNWLPRHHSLDTLCDPSEHMTPPKTEEWIKKNLLKPGQRLLQVARDTPPLADLEKALENAWPKGQASAALRAGISAIQNSVDKAGTSKYRLSEVIKAIHAALNGLSEDDRREHCDLAREVLDSYKALSGKKVIIADQNYSFEVGGFNNHVSDAIFVGIGFDLILGKVAVLNMKESMSHGANHMPTFDYPVVALPSFEGQTDWYFPKLPESDS